MYFIFQKVEYYGKDTTSMTYYTSVIRNCPQGHRIPHPDNCSDKLLANPGCMIRHCCSSNLCNGANSPLFLLSSLSICVFLNATL